MRRVIIKTPFFDQNYQKKFIFLICMSIPLLFHSCGNQVENSKYIPQNTSFVLCFNMANFSEKASDWLELLNNDIPFLNIKKDDVFLENLHDSGVDFNSIAYFFSNMHIENEDVYYALSVRLSSESKFDEFLRKSSSQAPEIKSYSGMRYAMIGNKSIIGWVNKVAIFIYKEAKTDEKVLREALLKLRDLPEDQSLNANNKQFQKLRISEYDIATWVNLESYEWWVKQSIRRFLLPIVINLQENYLTAVTKFEKGKIFVDTKLYNLNESLKEYQNLVKSGIDQHLILSQPSFEPMAVLGLGLDMNGVKQLVDNIMLQYIKEQTISMTGVTPDDILEMLSGDMLTILKDIKPDTSAQPGYEYLFSMGIRQKQTLDSILNKFSSEGTIAKRDSFYYAPEQEIYMIAQDSILFITPSIELRNKVFAFQKQSSEIGLPEMARESFIMAYSNVERESRQKLPEDLFNGDKIFEGITKYTETPLESFSINTQPLKDTISQTHIVLNMKDKAENSLQILVNTFKNDDSKK